MKIAKANKLFLSILLYIILISVFSGINFSDGRSPGWFIQTLPVNDAYNDLFFIDSLHGWMVSTGYPGTSDTGYIIHTSNGGYNWVVQKAEPQLFWRVQFLDTNYGYVVGGNTLATIQKTTNGGINWNNITGSMSNKFGINDISFVNKDTGWVCINDFFDGGIYKTMNGGMNWILQKFDQRAYHICFISKDSGWYSTDELNGKLYRTINGGINWTLIFTSTSNTILYLYFFNGTKGWIQSGGGTSIKYTTDGGFTWNNSSGNITAGYNFSFINENTGYSGSFNYKIAKTINGGVSWGYQTVPLSYVDILSALKNDTSKVWGGMLMHTTDGGGPLIYTGIIKGEHFIPAVELHQNYPNPFNPSTKIKFAVYRSSYVELVVYDINGREIETLLDNKLFNFPCIYEVDFDANEYNLSSGVYFYKIKTETENHKEIFIDTKKMLMIK